MKAVTTLLLLGGGMVGGYLIGSSIGDTPEARKENGFIGVLIGFALIGIALIVLALLKKYKPDTVNYTLRHKAKRVYEGVCYNHRIDARMSEHIKDGKIFDTLIYDAPKARQFALALERARILKHSPIYNVQHNCV